MNYQLSFPLIPNLITLLVDGILNKICSPIVKDTSPHTYLHKSSACSMTRCCWINFTLSIESLNISVPKGCNPHDKTIERETYTSSHTKPLTVPSKCLNGNFCYRITPQEVGIGPNDHQSTWSCPESYAQALDNLLILTIDLKMEGGTQLKLGIYLHRTPLMRGEILTSIWYNWNGYSKQLRNL